MSEPCLADINHIFETLSNYVTTLGAAVVAIWGVDDKGVCRCSLGAKCRSTGKHPNGRLCPRGVTDATMNTAIIRQWIQNAPHSNWGIRCGGPLPNGGFLGVFDWDPRNGSEESLGEMKSAGRVLPDTVTQSSGGGGGHRLYRFPVSPASRTLAPGLDLQGAGKYIVVAPSQHASKGVYAWELGMALGEHAVAAAPGWMVEGTEEAKVRPSGDAGTARETILGEAFALGGRIGPVMPNGMMYVNCPHSDSHSDGRGKGEDASCVILPPAGGSRFGGFKCQHGHCANLKWGEVMGTFPKEIRDQAFLKWPRLVLVQDTEESEPTPVAAEESEYDKLMAACTVRLKYNPSATSNGYNPKKDTVNINVILTYDPRWMGILKWDEFAQVLRFTREPPWHPDDKGKEQATVWTDSDVVRLDLWMRRYWNLEMPVERLREAVYVVGQRDSVNPLREWLDGLVWDGSARLETWLHRYLGCPDTQYTRIVGRKWILSAVARGFVPGCSAHHVMILEGPQGLGKSTAIAALVPVRSWFSDSAIDINSKDAYLALNGKTIVELAELAALKRTELERVKAFFTSPIDTYRPPYCRENIAVPRTCVFAGTVNLGEYLSDSTGARRFWPVRCGVIDTEGLREDSEQIWAEAAALYKSWVDRGKPQSECLWWPSLTEVPLFEAQQAEREVQNPWTESIAIWVASERGSGMARSKGYLTCADVARGALMISDKDLTTSALNTIAVVLGKDLKWIKRRIATAGAKSWGYFPPGSSDLSLTDT